MSVGYFEIPLTVTHYTIRTTEDNFVVLCLQEICQTRIVFLYFHYFNFSFILKYTLSIHIFIINFFSEHILTRFLYNK